MFLLYIFVALIHATFSFTPCQDGVEIISRTTRNPWDLIGNWTYVYHWDNLSQFKREFIDDMATHPINCPEISLTPVTMDYVLAKQAECRNFIAPFRWTDARLKLDAPLMRMKGGIIFVGQKDSWLMSECGKMVRVVMKKVSEDYMVVTNPEVAHISEMIAKKIPTIEELKCVAHNVDVGKGMKGVGLCY